MGTGWGGRAMQEVERKMARRSEELTLEQTRAA